MTTAKKTWSKPQVKKLTDSEIQSLAESHQPVRDMLKRSPRSA
ncbi:MAG: hypothetical protein ACTHJK_14455 [Sphingomicrobium sp.]